MSPSLSKMAQSVGGSTVVGMRRKADAVEARGMRVIDFGIGEPDFTAPSPVAEAAIRAIREGRGGYVDPRGLPELRAAIADFEQDAHGHQVSPDQIVVPPGSYGGLTAIARAVLDPGSEAIVVEPGWGPYKAIIGLTGARAVGALMPTENGRFLIDADSLTAAASPQTRAIFINTPWNPTGRVLEIPELEAIAAFAAARDLWIVADEVYSELVYPGARHRSIATLGSEVAARTAIATSLSKSFAMTGWRLGYCVAPMTLAPTLARIVQYASRCATSFVQHAAVTALRECAPFVEEMRAEYAARRDAIAAGLNRIEGVACPLPEGAFYAFPAFPAAWGDSKDVANRLLEEAGVLLTPGSAYGPASRHHLRLSFATSLETIEEGLDRLQAALPPPAETEPIDAA